MSPICKPPSVETIPEPPEDLFNLSGEGHIGVKETGVRGDRPGVEEPGHMNDVRDEERHHKLSAQSHRHMSKPRPRSVSSKRTSASSSTGSPRSKSAHNHRRNTVAEAPSSGVSEGEAPGLSDEDTEVKGGQTHAKGLLGVSQLGTASPSVLSSRTSMTDMTAATGSSGSSSGSGSTITQASFTRKEHLGKAVGDTQDNSTQSPRRTAPHPDALSFLDPDSPAVTDDTIKRSVAEAATWHTPDISAPKSSPSARSSSSSSSASSSFHSNASSVNTAETDRSISPERSIDGEAPAASSAGTTDQRQQKTYRYGTPEMPRGTANLPHLSGNVLTSRISNQSQVKHLPRAEKLPLSGYELLASRLSATSRGHRRQSSFSSTTSTFTSRRDSIASSVRSGGSLGEDQPKIKPIYRKFEALNHRLLLHLQDELSELEEQLHRLDTTDTQTRRLQNRILPASRRAEFMAGGELQWHKTDILGKIGYKLEQYNHVLASYSTTRDLPSPSLSDISDYRAYLARENPITEIETRFLDPVDDLVSLAPPPESTSSAGSSSAASEAEDITRAEYYQALEEDEAAVLTPMPHGRAARGALAAYVSRPTSSRGSSVASFARAGSGGMKRGASSSEDEKAARRREMKERETVDEDGVQSSSSSALVHLAITVAVAVLVPVLTFAVIPGFLGRMTVVLLVGLSLAGSLMQSGSLVFGTDGSGSSRDILLCAGVYGIVMAVVAGRVG